MKFIKNLEDLEELKQSNTISDDMIRVVSEDIKDVLLEFKNLGITYSPEKYGFSIIIEKDEIIKEINHLNTNILTETVPVFVCEYDTKIIKACVQLRPSYYLQIYFYKFEQPVLFEWCFKQRKSYF